MELLRDTHIDFMKYRKFWITVSFILMGVGFFAIFVHGELNTGIDFAGGTQLELRFRQAPQVDQLRSLIAAAGLGEPAIQRFGKEADHEAIIKTALTKGTEEGSRDRIVAALNRRLNQTQPGKVDLNLASGDVLTQLLASADPDHFAAQVPAPAAPQTPPTPQTDARQPAESPQEAVLKAHYAPTAQLLVRERAHSGLFSSSADLTAGFGLTPQEQKDLRAGLTPAVLEAIKQRTYLGDFGVLGVESVGPQIGRELRRQGFLAVAMSMLGMLVYIWLRFELRFGIGAVMASVHDVLVTLGLFTLMRFEFNLTTIAAFLTLIGYSMNDTVVIFDRIRENMRKNKRKPLLEVMNDSINQTLSRTIMTSGLTMLSVAALLILGGDVLRGFSFVMTVGIIVGTYSSIYIASPFALLWERFFGNKRAERLRETASAGEERPRPGRGPGAGGGPVPAGQPTPPQIRAGQRRKSGSRSVRR